MKSSTPEAGRKSRRARGRQHVVGTRNVVADRLRRVRADEDCAGIANSCHKALGIVGENFEMLRRKLIDQRDRIVKLAHDDDGAEIAP